LPVGSDREKEALRRVLDLCAEEYAQRTLTAQELKTLSAGQESADAPETALALEDVPRTDETPNEFERFVMTPPDFTQLPPTDQVTRASVCWISSGGIARRYEAMPGKDWVETNVVELYNSGMPQDISEEEWVRRLYQREKQVQVGKSTIGYRNLQRIPPEKRPFELRTPRVQDICSKRAFDSRLKAWRIKLHQYGDGMLQIPEERNRSRSPRGEAFTGQQGKKPRRRGGRKLRERQAGPTTAASDPAATEAAEEGVEDAAPEAAAGEAAAGEAAAAPEAATDARSAADAPDAALDAASISGAKSGPLQQEAEVAAE
jgi:hypothetical protein